MKTFIVVFFASLLFWACSGPTPAAVTPKKPETDLLNTPPANIVQAIKNKFPNAVPYKEGVDSLVNHLKKFGIQADRILWGQSTCVDDITNTKNKLVSEIKGPFNFGGL